MNGKQVCSLSPSPSLSLSLPPSKGYPVYQVLHKFLGLIHSFTSHLPLQVRSYSPQFMLTISSVDSLEAKLNQAQDDLGIPHYGRVSITYRSNQDTGYVCTRVCQPYKPLILSLSLSQILVIDGIQWSSSCLVLVHILFTAEGSSQKESFLQIQSICKHVTFLHCYFWYLISYLNFAYVQCTL